MSENRGVPRSRAMSSTVPWNGGDAPCEHERRRDSPRLHAIPAGLAMRDDEREEVIGKPQE